MRVFWKATWSLLNNGNIALNGDIVVALIDNDEATLKFFQKNKDDTITLLPANDTLSPMIFSAERIQIRSCRWANAFLQEKQMSIN